MKLDGEKCDDCTLEGPCPLDTTNNIFFCPIKDTTEPLVFPKDVKLKTMYYKDGKPMDIILLKRIKLFGITMFLIGFMAGLAIIILLISGGHL